MRKGGGGKKGNVTLESRISESLKSCAEGLVSNRLKEQRERENKKGWKALVNVSQGVKHSRKWLRKLWQRGWRISLTSDFLSYLDISNDFVCK